MPPLTRVVLPALLAAAVAGPAAAYRLATRSQGTVEATGLSFAGPLVRAATAQGVLEIRRDDVDFYETFSANVGSGGGNLIVFRTGAVLRYETIEMKSGQVKLGMGSPGHVLVPEALIDFEESVVEGALVNLPAGAGAAPAVARADRGGEALAGEGDEAFDDSEPVLPARSRRSGRAGLTRRGGREPAAELSSADATQQAAEAAAARDAAAEEAAARQVEAEATPPTPLSTGDSPGGSSSGGQGNPTESGVDAKDQSEQVSVQVVVTTDYGEDIAGLSLDLMYPATCTVTHPTGGPAFSGFAAGFTTAVNVGRGGNPSSPLRIGGYAPPNTKASGPGEFLRAVFQCGSAPDMQGFKVVGATAHDEHGNALPAFTAERTDASVQTL